MRTTNVASTGTLRMIPENLKEKGNYSLNDCRKYNQVKRNNTDIVIQCDCLGRGYECTPLLLPDGAHPWNMLHSVIEQYYKREIEMCRMISSGKQATEKSEELQSRYNELQDAYSRMDKALAEIKSSPANERYSLEELNVLLSAYVNGSATDTPQNAIPLLRPLHSLLQDYPLSELIESTGDVLDELIEAMDYAGATIRLVNSLMYARRLQRFFMETDQEIVKQKAGKDK